MSVSKRLGESGGINMEKWRQSKNKSNVNQWRQLIISGVAAAWRRRGICGVMRHHQMRLIAPAAP